MLLTRSLTFQYPGREPFSFPDVQCAVGENLLILGESGSGKTTLLHLLAGILSSASGEIIFNNTSLSALNGRARDTFRGQNIGMVFQKHMFIEGLSVFENLVAAQHLSGVSPDKAYLDQLLARLGISTLSHKPAHQLSQGEQQRFSIARALASKPSWVLADEPTSSLDDRNCQNFTGLMELDLTGKPLSWVVATHDQRIRNYFTSVTNLY